MNAMTPNLSGFHNLKWRIEIVALISRGVSISEACEVLGVSRARYYRHLKADPAFAYQVECARMLVSIELFNIVKKSALNGDSWRSAAWLLEKRYPREWGSIRDRLRLEGCTCGASERVCPK